MKEQILKGKIKGGGSPHELLFAANTPPAIGALMRVDIPEQAAAWGVVSSVVADDNPIIAQLAKTGNDIGAPYATYTATLKMVAWAIDGNVVETPPPFLCPPLATVVGSPEETRLSGQHLQWIGGYAAVAHLKEAMAYQGAEFVGRSSMALLQATPESELGNMARLLSGMIPGLLVENVPAQERMVLSASNARAVIAGEDQSLGQLVVVEDRGRKFYGVVKSLATKDNPPPPDILPWVKAAWTGVCSDQSEALLFKMKEKSGRVRAVARVPAPGAQVRGADAGDIVDLYGDPASPDNIVIGYIQGENGTLPVPVHWRSLFHEGMISVTGGTGSGKSWLTRSLFASCIEKDARRDTSFLIFDMHDGAPRSA